MTISRRAFVQTGLLAAATPLISTPAVFAQSGRIQLNYATLKTGVSVIINEYLKHKRPDLDNGLEINITNEYTSVSSYYSDFISGTFELGIGAWDTYLRMYKRGVPTSLATTITTGTMINIVTRDDGPSSVEELRGKTVSAIAASGAFNMCKSTMQDLYDLELGEDITVQNVPSPAQAMTLLMAGNVDAALSWEPNVSAAMSRMPGLRTIFNLGQEYEEAKGMELPYFAFALRNEAIERNAETAALVHATFAQLMDQINADPMDAFTIAAPELNVEPEVLMQAYEAGRLQFSSHSMQQPEGRQLVREAQAFIDADDAEIDDAYFAS
ncbi:ABC transporter substrate-binding protein [Pararhodobacter oceanensis]|uniref:ABC transporter substrate-binding protein n=1 Tax=Pararhodobacter oceanensis TaxID=2172121 RepID=UPI003A90861E